MSDLHMMSRDAAIAYWDSVFDNPTPGGASLRGLIGQSNPKPQRIAPAIAADHTMRATALLALSDTKTGDMKVKAQNLVLQHLEAAFVSANPGYGPNG